MAKVLQNNYYTLKLTTDQALQLDGKTYTYEEASNNGDIITSGDCLAFQKVLEYKGIKENHIVLFRKVEDIRKRQRLARQENNRQLVKTLQEELDNLLYIDDIISIKVLRKKDYSYLARNGFTLNGKHYVRFAAGSGNLRRNTIIFINDQLFSYMQEVLMCGLNGKIKRINLAKLSAYFALSMSSVLWVRTPRVCVCKDFFTTIKDQHVNYIDKDDNIHEVIKDIELNSADGQGLISPDMAINWAGDMYLDYTPSSFVVRSCWVKGQLVPFNFKKYAHEHNITTITDRWGDVHNIDDIDVILSESQFKMAKYYGSWETYESFYNEYNLKWGVARYNKLEDAEYTKTNYQYLQVLDLEDEGINGVSEYTMDWIKKICSGDLLYTLAYTVGISSTTNREILVNSCSSTFTKAIMKNADFLQDSYIQKKIYNSVKEAIKAAKMGRIWVRGNYQFAISDPVAQCRHALGLSPDGLIPAHHVYSQFWNDRGVTGEIICCRSPLTTYSEVVVNELSNTEEMQEWYQYIKSGFIQSIYDINVMLEADGDYDGDILFSTNDKYFFGGVRRGELPIIYDKETVPTQRITLPNQIKCDCKALNTIVGQITNYGTCMYAMLPMFDKDSSEYKELDKRVKMTRKLQGEEIDKAKGTTPPNIPKEWLKKIQIEEEDTEEEKRDKYKHNSLVIGQKPYFFIYLYSNLMKDYKSYKRGFDVLAHKQFGCSLASLLAEERTDEETNFLRRYRKYSPVLETGCVMNKVCKSIEQVDNSIKWDKKRKNMLIDYADFSHINKKVIKDIYTLFKNYNSRKSVRGLEILVETDGLNSDEVERALNNNIYRHKDEIRDKICILFDTEQEMFNHVVYTAMAYDMPSDIVWEIMGDCIIDCLPWGETYIVVRDENGSEYLGQALSVKKVD